MKQLLFLLLLCGTAFGQGSRYDSIAFGSRGQPIPNAQITVCTSTATGLPCSPQVLTYTDATLTTSCAAGFQVVLSNTSVCQATGDANGNFGFWLPAGSYKYTITGPSFQGGGQTFTITAPFGPGSNPTFGALTAGSVSSSGAITAGSVSNIFPFNGGLIGGVCDGVTDDSAHWTTAMSTAASLGGITILFPVGKTCFFSSTITVNQPNVSLDCEGGWSSNEHGGSAPFPTCELLFAAGNNLTGIDTNSAVGNISSSVSIKHLYIKGQAVGTGTGNGIHLTSNAPVAERNVVQGFGNCGISIDSSGTNANANFFELRQNYSKFNKGDGYCFNGATNGNTNVGIAEQNTADSNGGWGFNLLHNASGIDPATNQFRANHCISNTSGCINVNGTSNTLIGNYTEVAASGITLAAGSSNTYVANPTFGGAKITDSGTLNTVFATNCGVALGTSLSNPCFTNQVNIGPVPGSASTSVFAFKNGVQFTNSFELTDIVNAKVYTLLNPAATPIFEFKNALNFWMDEGACTGGNAAIDQFCADSTSHRFKMNNNNGGAVTVGTTPAYNAAGVEILGAPHLVQDVCTLGTNCAITLAGSAAFTSATTYTCTCHDQTTPLNACGVNQTGGAGLTITGTGTDVIRYMCVGN